MYWLLATLKSVLISKAKYRESTLGVANVNQTLTDLITGSHVQTPVILFGMGPQRVPTMGNFPELHTCPLQAADDDIDAEFAFLLSTLRASMSHMWIGRRSDPTGASEADKDVAPPLGGALASGTLDKYVPGTFGRMSADSLSPLRLEKIKTSPGKRYPVSPRPAANGITEMPDTIGSSVPPPRVLPGARARVERSQPEFLLRLAQDRSSSPRGSSSSSPSESGD